MINTKDIEFLKKLGKRVRYLRKEGGHSQESFAYAADLSLSQIGRIERGEINPTICTLKVLADTLKIDLKSLTDFKYK